MIELCDSSDDEMLLELWNPIKIPVGVYIKDDDDDDGKQHKLLLNVPV